MVSIAAFQAVDPGSIPGRRNTFFFHFSSPFFQLISNKNVLFPKDCQSKFEFGE